jgi:hypothetical protein
MKEQNAEIMAIPMQASPAEFDLILVMKPINLEREPDLLAHDINFWGHCGGVRIHDWRSCRELLG